MEEKLNKAAAAAMGRYSKLSPPDRIPQQRCSIALPARAMGPPQRAAWSLPPTATFSEPLQLDRRTIATVSEAAGRYSGSTRR